MKRYKCEEPKESIVTKNLKYQEVVFCGIDLSEYKKEELYMLGDILEKYKKQDKAKKAIKEALKKEDIFLSKLNGENSKEDFLNIGLRLGYWGRNGDAVEAYRKAVEIDKNYFEALYRLWGILKKWGNLNESDKIESEKIYENIKDYIANSKTGLIDLNMPIINSLGRIENILDGSCTDPDYKVSEMLFRVRYCQMLL